MFYKWKSVGNDKGPNFLPVFLPCAHAKLVQLFNEIMRDLTKTSQ